MRKHKEAEMFFFMRRTSEYPRTENLIVIIQVGENIRKASTSRKFGLDVGPRGPHSFCCILGPTSALDEREQIEQAKRCKVAC